LLGTCLIAGGACIQLGLSSIAALFILGLVLSFSKHRWDLKAMIAPTEQPVLLPMLLLAGASVNLQLPLPVLVLLLVGLLAKLALRILFGTLISRRFVPTRAVAVRIGISQMSCGIVSVIIATGIAARSNSALGNALLLFTAACMLLGEAIGPAKLRQVLDEVDEIAGGDSEGHNESLIPESEMLKLKVES
jgi:Kef-type K+ transport system membrane component KefB